MVIAATIVMLITMTFRMPYGAYASLYALTISRESPQTTGAAVKSIVAAFVLGGAYVLISACFFFGDPLPRLLWIAGSLFASFYVINTTSIRADLLSGKAPGQIEVNRKNEPPGGVPLLREMERAVPLIPMVFSGSGLISAYVPSPPSDEGRSALFVADALSNVDHFKFGLRGCVAASLCYIIYTSVDWPGISTSITTCLLTALYRLQLPGFELPEPALVAQQEFDNRLAGMLDGMADRMEGKRAQGGDRFEDAFERLEQTVRNCCSERPQELLTTKIQTFLALSRSIDNMAIALDKEI
jgi:hypothetical protein